ncbi:hypothetical protein WAK64_13160 [Bacillus spongiae]|uniref:Uncharacterized protein n=1 Tax=Bacillus spongiae TaxID=2683610 RepID=A0ABU8HF51_9BACI
MDALAYVIVLALSFCFLLFYKRYQDYLVPYIIFEIGLILWVISLLLVKGWLGIGLGIVSLIIITTGIIVAVIKVMKNR